MTEFEIAVIEMMKKEYRHFLRLSMERDIYTKPQAAFRLGCSENVVEAEYLATGKVKMLVEQNNGKVDLMYSGISIKQYVEANHFSFTGKPEEWLMFKRMMFNNPELIKIKKVG